MAPRSRSEGKGLPALERATLIVLGLYLAGSGLNAIGSGHFLYLNYLGSPVAAPIAVALGLALLVAAMAVRQ